MRPFKHVAQKISSGERAHYQDILGVDVARLQAPWGEIPVIATTERDFITLYYWSPDDERWLSHRIEHEALDAAGSTPDDASDWNWSERVALACVGSTLHVFYKRAFTVSGETAIALVHRRYRPRTMDPTAGDHRLDLVGEQELERVVHQKHEVGRGLWASAVGDDELVLLYQRRTSGRAGPIGVWSLMIRRFVRDAGGPDLEDKGARALEAGGFDFDARLDARTLHVVHRRSSEAFVMTILDVLGRQSLTSGSDADAFFRPLRWARIDLDTFNIRGEDLPGGEHPQIHRTSPLLLTMNRPSTLEIGLNTPVIPLPPAVPRVRWQPGPTDQVMIYQEGTQTYRGTLLTADALTLPLSHADMHSAALLFQTDGGLFRYASAFRTSPVEVLATTRADKSLTLDVLHHREFLGLYRTRLQTTLSDGAVTVTDRAFEVWDIGHAQIGDSTDLEPATDAENRQFAPMDPLALTAAPRVAVPEVHCDNTIGGHLVADTTREPVGFFAYTDLGDGGLRAVYAPDMGPLAEPPPIEDEKILRPDQVTGPPIPCDVWVDVPARDWVPGEVPAYSVGIGQTGRSLGSALEVPLDFLLDAADIVSGNGDGPGGLPLEPAVGLNRGQLRAIDTFRAELVADRVETVTLDDGTEAEVMIAPGGGVAGVDLTLTVSVAGATPTASWTAIRVDDMPAGVTGPVSPQALASALDPAPLLGGPEFLMAGGNPATLALPGEGEWRLSVFLVAATPGGAARAAFVDMNVVESTHAQLTQLYDGIADGEWHQIGDLENTMLRYDIRYGVGVMGNPPANIRIAPLFVRASEIRFRGRENGQGLVDARHVISFTSDEMRLKKGLDLVFQVNSLAVTLRYGRSYTPGMLLRDSRALAPLDGRNLRDDPSETTSRNRELRHAGIGSKPVADGAISDHEVEIDLGLTPGAIVVATIVTLLALIGAAAAVAVIVGLLFTVTAGVVTGIVGVVVAVLATIAIVIFIVLVVPGIVSDFAEGEVAASITSPDRVRQLNALPLLRYSGEGTSEAIARAALFAARDQGLDVPFPAGEDAEEAGLDRFHGQLFQMVFASEGICRVLLRLKDCDPTLLPGLPGRDGGDDRLPGGDIDVGVGSGGG